jgi:hypothetical protein
MPVHPWEPVGEREPAARPGPRPRARTHARAHGLRTDGVRVVPAHPVLRGTHAGVIGVQQSGEVELDLPVGGQLLQRSRGCAADAERPRARGWRPARALTGVIHVDVDARGLPGRLHHRQAQSDRDALEHVNDQDRPSREHQHHDLPLPDTEAPGTKSPTPVQRLRPIELITHLATELRNVFWRLFRSTSRATPWTGRGFAGWVGSTGRNGIVHPHVCV